MRRLALVVLLTAGLGACRSAPPEEILARYDLVGREGKGLGEARLLAAPDDGLADRIVLTIPGKKREQTLRFASEVSYADDAVTYTARRVVDRAEDEVAVEPEGDGLQWRQAKGLSIERRSEAADVDGVVDLGGMPSDGPAGSLAAWTALLRAGLFPKAGGRTLTVLNARTGRVEPLRIEVRERRTLTLGGKPVDAVRSFAWTAGSGQTLWISEAGRLLSTTGILGTARASLPGLVLPPTPRAERPASLTAEAVYADGDGVRLAGTLTRPKAAGARPLPLVILIHGSGPMDRDENGGGITLDIFRHLAYRLGALDVAVLRYDKRGVGESTFTGKPSATLPQLASDVRTWMDVMGKRPDVDGRTIFLVGHSEGGYIGPMVAVDDPRVKGVVMLAGAAQNLAVVIREQAVLVAKALGADDEALEQTKQDQDIFIKLVRSGRDRELSLPGGMKEGADWLRSEFLHDSMDVLHRLRTPLLALFGGDDFQVPVGQAPILEEATSADPDVTVVVLPGLDHLFMPVEAPVGLGMYFDPDRRLSGDMLERVTAWLGAHLPADAARE